MNQLIRLIAAHCPNGVEFKTIGEIGELIRGNGMPKSDFSETGTGCIHYGQIYTHYGTWTTETISRVPNEKAAKLAKVDPGDLIITNTSENLDDVCKAVAWLGDEQIVTGGHATVLKHDLDPKYLSYYLQTPHFHADKKRHATGAKVIDVSAKKLAQISIPVPPREVQTQIAAVLDHFSKLEAELEIELQAELEARCLQYQHYRDTLLSLGELTALGKIGTFTRGRRFTKSDYVTSGIACIHYGDIYTQYDTYTEKAISQVRADLAESLRYAKTGDVVIAAVGETVEDVGKAVAWMGESEVAVHDDCFTFHHDQNSKFIAFGFQTAAFNAAKSKFVARAKVKRLSGESLAKLKIPLPSLEEQVRVVDILEKFDGLVKDLSIRLPAEIDARRKQYAHYRDQLMDFEKAA